MCISRKFQALTSLKTGEMLRCIIRNILNDSTSNRPQINLMVRVATIYFYNKCPLMSKYSLLFPSRVILLELESIIIVYTYYHEYSRYHLRNLHICYMYNIKKISFDCIFQKSYLKIFFLSEVVFGDQLNSSGIYHQMSTPYHTH